MLLGLLSGASAPTYPATDPATLTTLRHVTTHNGWWRTGASADPLTGNTTITRHTVTSPAKDLRVRWGSHTGVVAGKGYLIHKGVEYPLTWGGVAETSIASGQFLTSDTVAGLQVEAGDVLHWAWESPAGAKIPSGALGWDTPQRARYRGGYAGLAPLTDSILSGSPQGIYGLTLTDTQAIVCLGDSILESGWMRRAAHAQGVAWTDLSQWAEGIPTTSLTGRLAATDQPLFTLGLTEYATNGRGFPWRDVAANLITQWVWMTAGPIQRLGQTTMPPYTSSTDGWTTINGQTATNVEWRNGLNGWLRDGAPISDGLFAETGTVGALRAGEEGHPLVGICDIAAAAEVTNSAGQLVWDVRLGTPTPDGAHPSQAGAALMEPVASAWFAAHM